MRPREPSSRHSRRLHVMLTADIQSVQPTVQLPSTRARHMCVQNPFSCLPRVRLRASALVIVTKRRRLHDLLTSGLLSSSRQQARHHCGRTRPVPPAYLAGCEIMRPHQLSSYSTQQSDAKGIVDFVCHNARFCDCFFVFGTLYYKCEICLSDCDEFINADVCGTVLKGNSLTGER